MTQELTRRAVEAQEEANRLAADANRQAELGNFIAMAVSPEFKSYSVSINQRIREISKINSNR
jgi:hypothetical protein